MPGSLESYRPDKPDRNEQEDSQPPANDCSCKKSRKRMQPAKWRCGKLRSETSQHSGHQDGGKVHPAAKKAGTPAPPGLPNEKNDPDKYESRLPEWRSAHGIIGAGNPVRAVAEHDRKAPTLPSPRPLARRVEARKGRAGHGLRARRLLRTQSLFAGASLW